MHMRDTTHSYLCGVSSTCALRLIQMCDVMRLHIKHESRTHLTHTCICAQGNLKELEDKFGHQYGGGGAGGGSHADEKEGATQTSDARVEMEKKEVEDEATMRCSILMD